MLLELQYSERTATNTSWSSVSASFLNSGGIRGAFSVGDGLPRDLRIGLLPGQGQALFRPAWGNFHTEGRSGFLGPSNSFAQTFQIFGCKPCITCIQLAQETGQALSEK